MPEGTRVHRCVEKVKRKGGVNPYAVCQASTGQSFATGKSHTKDGKKVGESFEQRLDGALGIVEANLPGVPGWNLGYIKPNTGKTNTGTVLKLANYPVVGSVIYMVTTIDDVRSVVALEEGKIQPDMKHAGTRSTKPPPYRIGHRAVFNEDDVLLGGQINNQPPLPFIKAMEETILYDWGYGDQLN